MISSRVLLITTGPSQGSAFPTACARLNKSTAELMPRARFEKAFFRATLAPSPIGSEAALWVTESRRTSCGFFPAVHFRLAIVVG